MSTTEAEISRQHLIDPEICIRCNTCEEMCPIDAITHDSNNYVVKFDLCNWCNACISPCPTGAIDNSRRVFNSKPFTIEEQLSWDILPEQPTLDEVPVDDPTTGHSPAAPIPDEVQKLAQAAAAGHHGTPVAPASAEKPVINLHTVKNPITATVVGNYRLTADDASSDIHHIILDFGSFPFPVLEGQSIGIIPPGNDENGKPHLLRMYSVASPRDGERPGHNNLSLTVKRVVEDHEGNPFKGVGSNYVCDLEKGDKVQVTGPYGSTFLMPNHPGSSLMMICTGTGSAPMRAMTEHRRRRIDKNEGGELALFFGARSPAELPYFGPLMKLSKDFIDIHFAFSRVPNEAKRYVQDAIRDQGSKVFKMLLDPQCYIYICGLKEMEKGVIEAFSDICRQNGQDWTKLQPELVRSGRFHIETY